MALGPLHVRGMSERAYDAHADGEMDVDRTEPLRRVVMEVVTRNLVVTRYGRVVRKLTTYLRPSRGS